MKLTSALMATHAFGLAFSHCAAIASPPSTAAARQGSVIVGLGERARLGDTTVTPMRVVEDSRCPAGVQCIQAGTVRLSARIMERRGRRDAVLALGQPIHVRGNRWLTLAAVCPPPRPPGARPPRYRFTLVVRSDPSAPPRADCRR